MLGWRLQAVRIHPFVDMCSGIGPPRSFQKVFPFRTGRHSRCLITHCLGEFPEALF